MGRVEARNPLKRHLTDRPSPRVIEALAGVADDEAVVFLARVGRARPELAVSILSTLDEIDNVRAAAAASALRKFLAATRVTLICEFAECRASFRPIRPAANLPA